MKTPVILFLISLFIAGSCNNDDDNSPMNLEGEYIGVFERSGNTSNVELNFNAGIFTGESEIDKFPAICNGNYSLSDNTIEFENKCVWTAEFDWTLILEGSWEFALQNNILIMTKANGDKYTLTKQ